MPVAVVTDVRTDLRRLLQGWRGLVFPRQTSPHPVTGRWRPTSPIGTIGFWMWTAIGIPLIAVGYPLAVLGLGVRYAARTTEGIAAGVGILVVVLGTAIVWGLLTVLAWFRFPMQGFQAVLAASIVGTVATVFAWGFSRVDGHPVSVALAYPFAVAAVLLPPVTAALYSPTLGAILLPGSESLAVWLLDNVLSIAALDTVLRREFQLVGFGFLGMWFGLSVPIGWGLGGLVTLAHVLRPADSASRGKM